jgi:hypothetical protein
VDALQAKPSPQLSQADPPQSMPVSSPLRTPSEQLTHTPFVHKPVLQSASSMHTLPDAHR